MTIAVDLGRKATKQTTNSLDTDQAQQNVSPDLDLNSLTLMVFLNFFPQKVDFGKNQPMTKKHAQLPNVKELICLI